MISLSNCYALVRLKIKKVLGRCWVSKLNKIEKDVGKIEKKMPHKKLRVLIGPSLAIYPPSFALDKFMSLALRLKGAEIIPIYCDSIQRIECNVYGGEWGGGENFSKNCENCRKTSEQLWRSNPNKPTRLSSYISATDASQIATMVSSFNFEEALNYEKDGISYGAMAKDILVNNYLVATPELIDSYESLLKVHLENLLKVSLTYERILDDKRPDRVISNDSYYGMWAILERHCKARAIPYYSQYPVTKNRSAFAHDDASMNLNFTKSWKNFSKIALTNIDEEKIQNWLNGERGFVINAAKLSGHESTEPTLDKIDPGLPTLILAANVIWDLAALNKQILFADMIDWIVETIEWFSKNSKFQLIIRPHPAETSPQLPMTRETVISAIELRGISLPTNVFLLKSDAKVTLNELIEKFNIRGVLVHTTTVGFECPARGLPVITTAKSPYRGFGFTIDPNSKQEYFVQINDLLSGERKLVPHSSEVLAKKFIKFYQFHYYLNTGLFVGNPPEISPDSMKILLGKEGKAFEYVVNSIIQGLPINSCDRWIPES